MTYFSYPKANPRAKGEDSKFLGCGKYVTFPMGELPGDDYEIANPQSGHIAQVGNIEEIMQAALILVPSSGEIEQAIYEKKDDESKLFRSNSLGLAYLLALIACSKEFNFKIYDDIWCTGDIAIHEGKQPCLKTVPQAYFSINIKSFLSQENSKLFIVPAANIQPTDQAEIKKKNAEILSLNDVNFYGLLNRYKAKKIILRVHWNELHLLVEKFFTDYQPRNDPKKIILRSLCNKLHLLTEKLFRDYQLLPLPKKRPIHFAFPNVKEVKEDSKFLFLGCGRYIALSSNISKIHDGYKVANPKNSDVAKVVQAAFILAPDSDKTDNFIYEKDVSAEYEGDSMEFAYLLALISRSRKLRLKKAVKDIWCTGAIDIKGVSQPSLKPVLAGGFDIKLENFLFQEDSNLFIVPAANIQGECQVKIEEKNAEVLSLKEFQPSIEKKTILTVHGRELELLVKKMFRRPVFLFSDLKILFLIAPSVTYIMFFLLWLHIFDFIYIDTIIERYTIAFGDSLIEKEKKFSDDIVLVTIEEPSFDISWRKKHALLIDKLSKAGAKVIAFDMYFEEQSEFDDLFIDAIKKAKDKGTDVIIGISELQKNEPKMFKGLKEAVSGYGILCINQTLLYSTKAPLLVMKANGNSFDSLSLAVANAFYRKDFIVRIEEQAVFIKHPDESIRNEEIKINLSDVKYSSCPSVDEGDQVANIFIDLSPLGFFKPCEAIDRSLHCFYNEVISSWSYSELERGFNGKIVLVGVQIPKKDCLNVYRGLHKEKCFGMEVHADVLNTILSWVHIQEYPPKQQLIFIAISAILGAVLVYAYQNLNSPYLEISLLLFSLTFIFGVTSLYFYTQYRILLNTAYYAAASLLTYGAVRLSNDRKA